MFWLMTVALIALDQWTKYWAYTRLRPVGRIGLIDGLIGLAYTENRGAAFSILQGRQALLVGVSIAASVLLVYVLAQAYRKRAHWGVKTAYAMLLAGAVGNLIDRVRTGFVVDFIEFQWISFPVFNVADICVTCGAALAGALHLIWKHELL